MMLLIQIFSEKIDQSLHHQIELNLVFVVVVVIILVFLLFLVMVMVMVTIYPELLHLINLIHCQKTSFWVFFPAVACHSFFFLLNKKKKNYIIISNITVNSRSQASYTQLYRPFYNQALQIQNQNAQTNTHRNTHSK